MKKFEIKTRFTSNVLYSSEHEALKDAVCAAIASGADLRGADLRGTDLSGTDLSGTDLSGTDLSGANLSGANLDKTIMPGFPDQEPPKSIQEAALRTKDWLANDRWTQGKWISTPDSAYAGTCLACLHGAVSYCAGEFGPELSQKLTDAGYTIEWNDASDRTKEEVLAALDAVAEAA